jgi:phosphate transport system permease protein
MFKTFRKRWFLWLYILLTVSIMATFFKPLQFEHTTAGIIVGTIITTVGAVLIAAVPAYLIAGVMAGIIRLPNWLQSLTAVSVYVLAGMPSIILGIIGFLLFVNALGFGWSMLSAMLTLILLLYPTLVTAFSQILRPFNQRYGMAAKSFDVGPLEFLFRLSPAYQKGKILDALILGWATSLGDTAAVMLTCGALTAFPESIMDSVRLINFHIFLLAMDIPGGMPEARSLSLLLIIFLLFLFVVPRLAHRYLTED